MCVNVSESIHTKQVGSFLWTTGVEKEHSYYYSYFGETFSHAMFTVYEDSNNNAPVCIGGGAGGGPGHSPQ